MSLHSTKVLNGFWFLQVFANLVSCAWMPWYHEDFEANTELEDEYVHEYGSKCRCVLNILCVVLQLRMKKWGL